MKLPFASAGKGSLASGAFSLFIGFVMASCSLIGEEPTPADGISESLHFNFKTPDWERKIDCTHLDLPAFDFNEGVSYTFATSQSTNSTFFISYPSDSSDIVNPANLKKYAITGYAENEEAFQFSLKLPPTEGSSERLVSKAGMSETSYNEVTAITYERHEEGEAIFKIKGKYEMTTTLIGEENNEKVVSGTYHFKIRTRAN